MHFRIIAKNGSIPVLLALLLPGCRSGPPRSPAVGEAYVGPSSVQIRSDTTPQSAAVATVKHGDRVEILQEKRKLLLVRTAGGAEGWTEERQLLAAADMAALKELAERAAKMPSQGQATTYADLRVHTQPSYQAPSFLVLKANDKFEVLEHAIIPRTEVARAPLVPPPPKKSKTERKSQSKNAKLLPPPVPVPPGPPPNWLDLSESTLPQKAAADDPHADKPIPADRWSLIRTPGGESGWVYTRLITMAVPDEVAQYAEGHRIVSYFPLDNVADGGQKKTTWLWATIGSGSFPYDFDSFRVFIWSLRRHRYETAHIELHLKGYSPVLLHPVEVPGTGRNKAETATARYPGFSVCIEKKDGARYRREYALYNERVRFVGEQPCEPPAAPVAVKSATPLPGADVPAVPQPKETLLQRMKKHWHDLTRHLFG